MDPKKVWPTYLLLLATMLFWGSAFVTSKISVESVPPSVAGFFRFGLGTVFAFIFLYLMRRRNPNMQGWPKGQMKIELFLGLIGVGVYNLMFFLGLYYSQASDGSMIIPILSPTITVILATLFLREAFGWKKATGLGLTMSGSLLFFTSVLSGGVESSAISSRITGDLFFLAAALCWSIYTIMGKKVLETVHPFVHMAYTMLFGSLLLGIIALPDLVKIEWGQLTAWFWINQLYLAMFPSVLANWFYIRGVQHIGPSRTSVFMFLVPVTGMTLAVWVLHETMAAIQNVGALLMIGGIWVINTRMGDKKKVPPSTTANVVNAAPRSPES